MEYYKTISEEHKESCMCKLCVNWDPQAISGNDNPSGYIVQHYERRINTDFSINIPQNITYFEAWRVLKGEVVDRGGLCDDMFLIGNDFQYFASFRKCVGTSGEYEFLGDIYWISEDHELFAVVDGWDSASVHEANGLKSTYVSEEIEKLKPVFSRDPFRHGWDLTDESKIYNTARDMLFRCCRRTDDEQYILSKIEEILPPEYGDMKRKIIEEWNNQ